MSALSIVAVAIAAMAALLAIYVIVGILLNYMELLAAPPTESKCDGGFILRGISIQGGSILANITNDACPIEYRKFVYVDVIVAYVSNSTGYVEWLRYSRDGGLGTWYDVEFLNDYVNPINQTGGYGLWDPGEIMVMNATPTRVPDSVIYIVIATYNGVVDVLSAT